MSNDLIERLRTNNCDNLYEFSLRKEAAKALEAKDKEIELLEKGYDALLDDRNEAWERVAELEAALREIVELAEPDQYDEWAGKIAKQALGEKE